MRSSGLVLPSVAPSIFPSRKASYGRSFFIYFSRAVTPPFPLDFVPVVGEAVGGVVDDANVCDAVVGDAYVYGEAVGGGIVGVVKSGTGSKVVT